MTTLRPAKSDPVSIMRAAARELLPVTVEMGPNQGRFSSFIGSVSEEGGGSVVLEPVAAEALPVERVASFSIIPADGRSEWAITATRITRESPHRVRVELARARAF